MKNEDINNIPAIRVTLTAPDTRNRTVVKVSAQRHDKSSKKRQNYTPAARREKEVQDNRFMISNEYPSSNGSAEEAQDFRPKKSDDFSGTPDNRFKESGAIWAAMDNRPKKHDGFRPAAEFDQAEPEGLQRDEDEISQRKPNYTSTYKKALSGRPDAEIPFGAFMVEVLFSALLLAAVCALLTIKINAGGELVAFFYPGNTLWAYMCISVAVFALARMFFSMQYYVSIFVAFGTLFAINLSWLTDFARLFADETIAPTIGFAIYYFLLVGLFFALWQLYKKRIKLHLIVKVLSAALACFVLVNIVIHLPL